MKAIACQAEIYFQFDSFNHENYMRLTTELKQTQLISNLSFSFFLFLHILDSSCTFLILLFIKLVVNLTISTRFKCEFEWIV